MCRISATVSGWIYFVGVIIAEVIMLTRVWAMWNRSRLVGFTLAVLSILFVAVSAAMYHSFTVQYHFLDLTLITSVPLPGCHPVAKSDVSSVSFLLLMAFEMLMLALTVARGVQHGLHFSLTERPPVAYTCSSFVYKFYQDGVLYYAALSLVSLLNVTILLAGPSELATAFVAPQHSLHTILSCRLLLRLREDAFRRQHLATSTEPLSDLVFNYHGTTTTSHGPNSRWWDGDNSVSWFGDAHSNVVGSGPDLEDEDAEPPHKANSSR